MLLLLIFAVELRYQMGQLLVMARALIFILGLIGGFTGAQAQNRTVPGQLLICLESGRNPDYLKQSFGQIGHWEVVQQVTAQPLNIWLIEREPSAGETEALKTWLADQPGVLFCQSNHLVTLRDTCPSELQVPPNDPLFGQQWHLHNTGQSGGTPGADLGMLEAWNQSTGGLSPAGDTIVMAVIDGGLCTSCTDLTPNLWVNRHEIPNDGIDNDNNGYFDDYRGWNVNNQNDNISTGFTNHGTAVSSIIAARGNNNTLITGMNWNTKIQFIAGTSGNQTTEAQILGAFEYVYKSRKAYNQSNGAKGAFVVAVNCSFGINFGTPSQYPLWCEMIEQLGQEGVLTIAAVANGNWNVDEVGDIPTTCPNEHLITVTSIDHNDQKVTESAWGNTSVDLGAYGQNILTLVSSSPGTSVRSGTSYAAPQVTAAIGLLYSAPCHNLIALAKENPRTGALFAKQLLLESTQPNASLQNLVGTNGRLHVGDLLTYYKDQCQHCPPPYWLTTDLPSTNQVILNWVETTDFSEVTLRWRVAGDSSWNLIPDVSSGYLLVGLQPCTKYEYALRAACDAGVESQWSAPVSFQTDGCCAPPNAVWTSAISEEEATISWSPVTAAQKYRLRYRDINSFNWITCPDTTATVLQLQDLQACTDYKVEISIRCGTVWSAYSSPHLFQTKGCGACYDEPYCPAASESASEEWIARVQIGNWEHSSSGHQGYQPFLNLPTEQLLVLQPGVQLVTTIEPAFLGLSYRQLFRIYIDFNQDGDFDDPAEAAFTPFFSSETAVTDTLRTPFFVGNGITRMRVLMKFKSSNFTSPPAPCETFEYGQVEDYCVYLSKLPLSSSTEVFDSPVQLKVAPNPAKDYLQVFLPENQEGADLQIQLMDWSGRIHQTWEQQPEGKLLHLELPSTLSAGMYFLRLQTANGLVGQAKVIKL